MWHVAVSVHSVGVVWGVLYSLPAAWVHAWRGWALSGAEIPQSRLRWTPKGHRTVKSRLVVSCVWCFCARWRPCESRASLAWSAHVLEWLGCLRDASATTQGSLATWAQLGSAGSESTFQVLQSTAPLRSRNPNKTQSSLSLMHRS